MSPVDLLWRLHVGISNVRHRARKVNSFLKPALIVQFFKRSIDSKGNGFWDMPVGKNNAFLIISPIHFRSLSTRKGPIRHGAKFVYTKFVPSSLKTSNLNYNVECCVFFWFSLFANLCASVPRKYPQWRKNDEGTMATFTSSCSRFLEMPKNIISSTARNI